MVSIGHLVLSTTNGVFMTFPSLVKIADERGIDLVNPTPAQCETLLVEAMRIHMPEAMNHLRAYAARADSCKGGVATWHADPSSKLGRQLISIHLYDALRALASEQFCSGKQLTFLAPCSGRVGGDSTDIAPEQVRQFVLQLSQTAPA